MDHDFVPSLSAANEEQLSVPTPASAGPACMAGRYADDVDLDSGALIYDYPPSVASSSMYSDAQAYGNGSIPPYYGYSQSTGPQYSGYPANGSCYSMDDMNYHVPQQHQSQQLQSQQQQKWSVYGSDYGSGGMPLAGAQRMQMWSAHNAPASFFSPLGGQQDSGVHSMTHSSATSVMSSLHAPSQISGVSSTDGCAAQLTDAQRARFHHIPLPINIRHASPEQIRQTLPDLIPLLNDVDEEEVVLEALKILQKIVDHFGANTLSNSGACASAVVAGVFKAMRAFKNNKNIIRPAVRILYYISLIPRHGMELLIQQMDETNAKCLDEFLDVTRIRELSCFKYSVLVLHSLSAEPKVSQTVIRYLRERRALGQLIDRLMEPNEKFQSIVIDLIQNLVKKDAEQKALFCELRGPSRLIRIIGEARYNNLLMRSAKLLGIIANSHPKAVVEVGAFEAFQLRLALNNDRRVIRELFNCLLNLSDVSVADRDLSALLVHLVNILGSSRVGADRDEARIQYMSAELLSNFSANNPRNKAFLVKNNVINAAFSVLFATEAVLQQNATGASVSQRSAEEIQNSVLTLLGNVCSGHDFAQEAQFEMMRARPDGDIFLQKIAKKRVILVRRTLRILCLTSMNETCLARFRDVIPLPNGTPPLVPYIKEIVECFQLATEYYGHAIEGINMVDLVQDCMTIFANLCCDNFLLETIISYLRHATINDGSDGGTRQILLPQFALRCANTRKKAMAFCAELARHPYASFCFLRDDDTMNILNAMTSQNDIPNCANNARRCLDWIYKYSSTNSNYYNLLSPNVDNMMAGFNPEYVRLTVAPPLQNGNYRNAHSVFDERAEQKYSTEQSKHVDGEFYRLERNQNYPIEIPPAIPSHRSGISITDSAVTSTSTGAPRRTLTSPRSNVDESRLSNEDSTSTLFADGCAETLDDDDEFGGAAARCSTPVDASALHATIDLKDGGSKAFNWDGAMSASTLTVVDQGGSSGEVAAQSVNFEQMNLYDEDFSIASAICGVSTQTP